MNTPIADFLTEYKASKTARFHMPGHKGNTGFPSDITEICGADDLYHAEGIIAESEANAAQLFGSARTLYSTEGSSIAIRTMLFLAVREWKKKQAAANVNAGTRPVILAGRNAHKVFLYSAALIDFDVEWMHSEKAGSLCECSISPEGLKARLEQMENINSIAAVYVTSPDYLGHVSDIKGLAKIAHSYGIPLVVDNAHGAYLKFYRDQDLLYRHPMELGADMCADSAHKTLPTLTGCAYLHIGKEALYDFSTGSKEAMALFASTSPSYLLMESLDRCNKVLSEDFESRVYECSCLVFGLKSGLARKGYRIEPSEPLKIVINAKAMGASGEKLADYLRSEQIECEYADCDYVVLMISPYNLRDDFEKLLGIKEFYEIENIISGAQDENETDAPADYPKAAVRLTIREAMFAPQEVIDTVDAGGRVCGAPVVSCPPAIPIVTAGEVIGENEINALLKYGHSRVSVVK